MRGLALVLPLTVLALPAFAAGAGSGKKLIEYGQGFPDTGFYREHVREMEKVGFDGVVIRLANGNAIWSLGYQVFTTARLDPKDFESPIADLRATHSQVFTDNFLQVAAGLPADVDWYDPAWDAVPYNAALMVRAAKLGGCKGLMIDPEEYGAIKPWSYREFAPALRAAHTYIQYREQVRKRGREFIRAVNREYPDITILFLLGPSYTCMCSSAQERAKAGYSLMADFFDGLCEGAAPGTTIVDGFEQSYGYRTRAKLFDARKRVLQEARSFSAVPDAYARHMRVGLGVWVDNDSNSLGWNTQDLSKNYFTPAEFRNSLAYALAAADRYVWVWSQTPLRWWTHEQIPQGFYDALKLAKKGPAPVNERDFHYPPNPPRASTLGGYSDQETFAEFYKTMTEILDLPKDGWRFALDPRNSGTKLKWFAPGFDDSKWRTISIGEFWETQGVFYDGVAWYRRTVDVPEVRTGKRIYIVVGAADEAAWVYLNGRLVGSHDVGEAGWDLPFSLDATSAIRPGQPNLIAIRVLDTVRLGGLWKSIKLMVK